MKNFLESLFGFLVGGSTICFLIFLFNTNKIGLALFMFIVGSICGFSITGIILSIAINKMEKKGKLIYVPKSFNVEKFSVPYEKVEDQICRSRYQYH